MAKKQKFEWVKKIEEVGGKKCVAFYLNDGLSSAISLDSEKYKDLLIQKYEEILFYTNTNPTTFIDLTNKNK